jgi:hypothetical protein
VINVRAFAIACVCALLQACGGGGGGGSGGPPGGNSGNGSFTLSASSASFRILAIPGQAHPDQTINMTVTNTTGVAGVGAAFPAAQGVPNWFTVAITGTMPDFQVRLSPNSFTPAGHYTATLLLGTGDANGAVLSSREVPVTMDVIAPVSVNNVPFSASFVSGSDLSGTSFSRGIQADQGTWTVTADVPWIAVPAGTQSGSATLSPVITASGLGIGTHVGHVRVENAEFAQGPGIIDVTIDVAAPTIVLNRTAVVLGGADGTELGTQQLTAWINTGTASHPWSIVLTDADQLGWMTSDIQNGSVNSIQNAVVHLGFEPGVVDPGTRTGTARFNITVNGVVFSESVPVTLNFESHRLVPQSVGVALSSFPARDRLQRTLTVGSSLGRSNVPWTATSNQPWLSVTPSGESGDALTLTASTSGLAQNQSHIAEVTLASTDETIERDETIRVALWVGGSDPTDLVCAPLMETEVHGLAVNPVEPLAYSAGFNNRIYVHNVYTGALVNTLQPAGLTHAVELGVSEDGRLLFVADFETGNTLVLDGNGQSSAVIATYASPDGPNFSPRYKYLSTRANGRSILWTAFGDVYDPETHSRMPEKNSSGALFTPSFSGIPVATPDGARMISIDGQLPFSASVFTQRFSMVGGKALHITDFQQTTNSTLQQSLNVGAAINASGTRVFADINANNGGPAAAKPIRVDAGPLVFLPDIPLSNVSYPEAIASTWDDRILYGLAFAADEVEDNLLILDGNGGGVGSSMSGPNNGGRHRGRLAVSGDLFRVVSTHAVPNGLNAPVSYVVSFYNLQ